MCSIAPRSTRRSGGQPFDTGTIGGARVVDVVDGDDGAVRLHVVEGPGLDVPAAPVSEGHRSRRWRRGASITCSSTPASTCCRRRSMRGRRRRDRELPSWRARVDDRPRARGDAGGDRRGGRRRQRRGLGDRPVTIRFVTARRRRPCRCARNRCGAATLRIIDIADLDVSACGGTHVARTGEIGLIAVRGWERFKGGTRLEFVCGGRRCSASASCATRCRRRSRLLSVRRTSCRRRSSGCRRRRAISAPIAAGSAGRASPASGGALAARRDDRRAAGRARRRGMAPTATRSRRWLRRHRRARPRGGARDDARPAIGWSSRSSSDVALDSSALFGRWSASSAARAAGVRPGAGRRTRCAGRRDHRRARAAIARAP